MGKSCHLLRSSYSIASFSRCALVKDARVRYLHHQPSRAFSVTTQSPAVSNMNTTRVLYEPIEDVERMEYYCPGGYHPVNIGDRFHNRYRVVHKLGHGTYSTIWLAKDEKSNRYAAVKVCTADSNPQEIDVLSKLSKIQHSPDVAQTMILSIRDAFNIQGPNGNHHCLCLVTDLARMSLSEAKNASWISLFQLDVARAIAAQLVIAVQQIHAQGFVHGDLHCGNILLRAPRDFNQLSTDKLYELYGEPILEPVNRLDGQTIPPETPKHGVSPIWLGEASENITLLDARILLLDFGESFRPTEEQRFECHTPLAIRPPEARFEPTRALDFPSDMWTLACTIWEIVAQRSLFDGFLTNEDDMTCQQISALGPLPVEWWETWEAGQSKFTKHGEPVEQSRCQYPSWEDRFTRNVQQPRQEKGMPLLAPSERNAFLAMLRPMLSFWPQHRPSAQQVLESEWMVKWALPEYEKIHNAPL